MDFRNGIDIFSMKINYKLKEKFPLAVKKN